MSDGPILAQILERLSAIEAGQTDPSDPFERMRARLDRIEKFLDRLDQLDRERDVPLHQRGFGVMDEPPLHS